MADLVVLGCRALASTANSVRTTQKVRSRLLGGSGDCGLVSIIGSELPNVTAAAEFLL
jgi:hypothetical protein